MPPQFLSVYNRCPVHCVPFLFRVYMLVFLRGFRLRAFLQAIAPCALDRVCVFGICVACVPPRGDRIMLLVHAFPWASMGIRGESSVRPSVRRALGVVERPWVMERSKLVENSNGEAEFGCHAAG